MAMAASLPLYKKKTLQNTTSRAIELTILLLLFSLLGYRLLYIRNHGILWIVAFCCEAWFTITWLLVMNCKWSPVDNVSYPDRLLQRYRASELPAVDMFVTTADPVLEPPILTINTVLSLLAVDYPSDKLACYVSDDAASPLTFYSLVEAAKFAKLWVPFCQKHNVSQRAPFRYFTSYPEVPSDRSLDFKTEWQTMKEGYERLHQKIEEFAQEMVPCVAAEEYAAFQNIDRGNHPAIIKVIWENKEGLSVVMPHLVYISREKRPNHPHHYKAGAMNVLTRVSGIMTNAPFMLNVDCDMYANNPQVVLHAMCFFLGATDEKECAFVQFPQHFYDGLKDDPFGNQMICMFKFFGPGIAGLQGPMYGGTGCFHRRKVIYGSTPEDKFANVEMSHKDLQKHFGKSMKFTESAAKALTASYPVVDTSQSLSNAIDEACHVASCGYEYNTNFGKQVGWMYGSCTEDVLTGLSIHTRGWRSIWCAPNPSAFLGSAPSSGPSSLIQQKRWSTGLLEVLFCSKTPILAVIFGKLQFRECLVYLWILTWAFRSIFEICYAVLPAFCILTDSFFLPKATEAAIIIPSAIFVIYNLYSMSEYHITGQTIRAWWNNQRMARLITMTSWLFGVLSVLLKLLGLSETVFEVTKKDQGNQKASEDEEDPGRFTFDDSPVYVPGVTLLLINVSALIIESLRFFQGNTDRKAWGIGEITCSIWVILCFSAFLKGLFRKGKYGVPLPHNIQVRRPGLLVCTTLYMELASVIYFVNVNMG